MNITCLKLLKSKAWASLGAILLIPGVTQDIARWFYKETSGIQELKRLPGKRKRIQTRTRSDGKNIHWFHIAAQESFLWIHLNILLQAFHHLLNTNLYWVWGWGWVRWRKQLGVKEAEEIHDLCVQRSSQPRTADSRALDPARHTVHDLTLRHTRFKDFLMKILLNIKRRRVVERGGGTCERKHEADQPFSWFSSSLPSAWDRTSNQFWKKILPFIQRWAQ